MTPKEREDEFVRRKLARTGLIRFAQSIDVPGRPVSDDDDESLFHPVETGVALHHRALLGVLERVYTRDIKQAMVFMPPGSAKSTYTSVVYPAYAMGKRKGSRIILGSYASSIAWKQSRRTRQIARSEKFRPIFGTGLVHGNQSVEEWAMENGSEYMAGGILSGMTGNRATDLIIDDPVAGRDEADSATIRKKTREAYEDDLTTRLMPGGATVIVQTRWHQDDLSGGILPVDWKGESGFIRGRDGLDWFVLCIPAEADRADDPLGRKIGEGLWPEWFKDGHWDRFKEKQRTWNALFQQKPTADSGTYFQAEWFDYRYERPPPKATLRIFGCSDYAVTPDGGDFTEHGIFGIDDQESLFVLDWWSGQTSSDVWVEKQCDLINKWQPLCWGAETGVIRRAVGPYLSTRMTQRNALTRLEWLPTTGDKEAMARGAQAMASMGQFKFPQRSGWHERVISQATAFPAGAYDDAVDVLGLATRVMPLVGKPKPKTVIPQTRVAHYEPDLEMGL
jgi:predicted phage terminase large subunit-like protein